MKYCVVKDTVTVIDGSENTSDVMLVNAASAGYTESEVEILTAEEYGARVAVTPVPPTPKTELELLREENDLLKQQVAGTSADFQAFMDDYYSKNPE